LRSAGRDADYDSTSPILRAFILYNSMCYGIMLQINEVGILLSENSSSSLSLRIPDALIQSMEKLIAKELNIKQGAMQELLTGRTRLV
jgi:hypothetical protein